MLISELRNASFRTMVTNRNLQEPDWGFIPTKGMETLSKQEMDARIKELAQKMARETDDDEIRRMKDEYACLMGQYMSPASPDRKSLYEQAKNTVKKISSGVGTEDEPIGSKTLVDYLNERDGIQGPRGRRHKHKYELSSGGLQAIPDPIGGHAFELYAHGVSESVMSAYSGKWVYTPTEAEMKLSGEFARKYDAVYRATKQELENGSNIQPEPSVRSVDYRA